jgi:hypothetical protein
MLVDNPVNLVSMFMEPVKTELISNQEENQKTAGDSDGQASNVNKRKSFVLFQVSQRDFEVISKHAFVLSSSARLGSKQALRIFFKLLNSLQNKVISFFLFSLITRTAVN